MILRILILECKWSVGVDLVTSLMSPSVMFCVRCSLCSCVSEIYEARLDLRTPAPSACTVCRLGIEFPFAGRNRCSDGSESDDSLVVSAYVGDVVGECISGVVSEPEHFCVINVRDGVSSSVIVGLCADVRGCRWSEMWQWP